MALIVASCEFAPWIVPDDPREKPRRLTDEVAFPFPAISRMFQLDAQHLVFKAKSPEYPPLLWQLEKQATTAEPARVQLLKTRGRALQDRQGGICCLLSDKRFVQWNGKEWLDRSIPQAALDVDSMDFVPDDRDRGWLLSNEHQQAAAICDFASGNWQVFNTLNEALEAQLPRGVKLCLPEYPYYETAYSNDGRIGGFTNNDSIMLFDNHSWRISKLHDLAGKNARLEGTAYFDRDGVFCVPVGANSAWQWNANRGWMLSDAFWIDPVATTTRNLSSNPRRPLKYPFRHLRGGAAWDRLRRMSDVMIETLDLHRSYRVGNKSIEVLHGIDLCVHRGERLFLCGPSGAGKTTLLYTLAGLERPERGNVHIAGADLYALGRREQARFRNAIIGYVFQNYYLLPELTALENVAIPGAIAGRDSTAAAMQALERVGLADRAEHLPAELSGGEQQRVAIARAIVNEPKVLFADEPTGNLDSKNSGEIMKILLDLATEHGVTLVVVTHDHHLAKAGDRTLIIRDGSIHAHAHAP